MRDFRCSQDQLSDADTQRKLAAVDAMKEVLYSYRLILSNRSIRREEGEEEGEADVKPFLIALQNQLRILTTDLPFPPTDEDPA